jgi:hypothetical protein
MALLDFFSPEKRTPPASPKSVCKLLLRNAVAVTLNHIIYRS